MKAVVDASVVVAALMDYNDIGKWAREQLKVFRCTAPHLVMVESTHVLRRYQLQGTLSGDLAAIVYSDLLGLPIQLLPYHPFAQRIWDLRDTVTPYDAWYVSVAEALDAPFVTLDARLAKAPGPTCRFRTPQPDQFHSVE